jgi:hypothetical protein
MFAGSNPAEGDGFLLVIKVHSITSFGGEVKPSVLCHKILLHVKDPYGIKEIFIGKVYGYFSPFIPASLLGVSAGCCQRALVSESGKIRT